MGSYLKVSASSMKRDADRMNELRKSIPALVNELDISMKQLSSCWDGPAWSTYQANVAYYIEILTEIYDYLSEYAASVQEASEKYMHAEQDICADIKLVNIWM